jgi:hypothetical protein
MSHDWDDWRRHVVTVSFYDEMSSVVSSPEQHLMLAILMRALFDCIGSGQVTPSDRRSAEKWFYHGKDSDWVFSFDNVATHLSSDPESFKRRVLRFLAQTGDVKLKRVVEPQ